MVEVPSSQVREDRKLGLLDLIASVFVEQLEEKSFAWE